MYSRDESKYQRALAVLRGRSRPAPSLRRVRLPATFRPISTEDSRFSEWLGNDLVPRTLPLAPRVPRELVDVESTSEPAASAA